MQHCSSSFYRLQAGCSGLTVDNDAFSFPKWVCPEHGLPLTESVSQLTCPGGHTFRVSRGIPRFVDTEAYVEHFGLQWRRYPRTQLDSYTGLPISSERLRRCLGENLWQKLREMSVLECGCGAGRFTEVLLQRGAVVSSIDLSSAVDANADSFPVSARHRIAQADISHLPFAGGGYDLVLCLGVVQHTPSPEDTIAALFAQVKPGGYLIFDHYTIRRQWATLKPIYRAIMKRLPASSALEATETLVRMFLPVHRAFRNSRPAWFLLCRVSPITTFYRSIPDLPENLQKEWALLDTHDSLTDWHKHQRTVPEVTQPLLNLGAVEINCEYGGNGVEARCRKVVRSNS
jgi:SAM-dependent methyltransferase